MSKTCPNCVHGQQSKQKTDKIECHFHAPAILHGSGAGWSDTKWPEMDYDEWCEEFYGRK